MTNPEQSQRRVRLGAKLVSGLIFVIGLAGIKDDTLGWLRFIRGSTPNWLLLTVGFIGGVIAFWPNIRQLFEGEPSESARRLTQGALYNSQFLADSHAAKRQLALEKEEAAKLRKQLAEATALAENERNAKETIAKETIAYQLEIQLLKEAGQKEQKDWARQRAALESLHYFNYVVSTPLDQLDKEQMVAMRSRIEEMKKLLTELVTSAEGLVRDLGRDLVERGGRGSAEYYFVYNTLYLSVFRLRDARDLLLKAMTDDPREALILFYATYRWVRRWIERSAKMLQRPLREFDRYSGWRTYHDQFETELDKALQNGFLRNVQLAIDNINTSEEYVVTL